MMINMRVLVKILVLLVSMTGLRSFVLAEEPIRQLGVHEGPDKVFARPVDQIIPSLQGAKATAINGRVGGELVFWGYTLNTGQHVQLYGCAMTKNVDCEARLQLICADRNSQVLQEIIEPGEIVNRRCTVFSSVRTGDLHPGCYDNETSFNLMVGLVSCPAN